MSVTNARSRVAKAVRKSTSTGLNPNDVADVVEARSDVAAEKLATYIQRIVDAAPRLSTDRIAELQALLEMASVGRSESQPPLEATAGDER